MAHPEKDQHLGAVRVPSLDGFSLMYLLAFQLIKAPSSQDITLRCYVCSVI